MRTPVEQLAVEQPAAAAGPAIPAVPAAPAAPAAPAIADGATSSGVLTGRFTVPRTVDDLRALRVRREELSDQLVSATGRRNDLVKRMGHTPAEAQAGLLERIRLLDHRILQIESDISESGEALTAAPSTVLAGSAVAPFSRAPSERTQATLGGLAMLLIFFPLALALSRALWRRGGRRDTPVESRESIARLARLEQAVDAIAVEVERVSESQRFLTRVLAEPAPTREALPTALDREPVH